MGLENCRIIFPYHMQRIVTGAECTNPEPDGLRGGRAPAIVPERPLQPVARISRFQLAPNPMNDDNNDRELAAELARLQQEHRDLDAAIDALHHSPAPDLLRLQRLKKRKLQLRDRIAFIEDQITPDIIA